MKPSCRASTASIALGLLLVACGPPRPVHDPVIDASMVAAAKDRARSADRTVDDPGTRPDVRELRTLLTKSPGQAEKLATEKRVVAYFRQRRLAEGAYLASYWVPITREAIMALASDPGSLSESQFLSALAHLRKTCDDPRVCTLASVDYFSLVRKDWTRAVGYLLQQEPKSAVSLNAVDKESGESPLNVAKSKAMIAVLTLNGGRARTREEIAVVAAEREARLAQENLDKEIERLEAREERREKEALESAAEERRQVEADADRAERQQAVQERNDQQQAAWKAAFDGVDKFKEDALRERSAVHEQRMAQIQAGSAQPSATSTSGASGSGQARIAALREEVTRRKQAAEDARAAVVARAEAAQRAANARAAEDRERKAAADAAAQDALLKPTPAATSTTTGPEVFHSGYFSTAWPDMYFERGLAERQADALRNVRAGDECRSFKGGNPFSPHVFEESGTLRCEEKEDRFAQKSVYRCRYTDIRVRCKRPR